jgi:peptide/nickel transport system substrate-binding protein
MRNISRRKFLSMSTATVAGAILAACGTTANPTAAVQPTQAAVQPTQAAVQPTQAAVQSTQAAVQPTQAAVQPTQAAVQPTQAAKSNRPTTWPPGNIPRSHTWIYAIRAANAVGLCSPLVKGYNHQLGFAVLYEPAAYFSALGNKVYPWLAESWKYNADATELTVTFRNGIKWSDGTPFTTKDPKSSMDRLMKVEGLNNSSHFKDEVDSVDVVDDYNLTIKLKKTDYRFFAKSLTFRCDLGDDTAILPSHIFDNISDTDLPNFAFFDVAKGYPVSTGAYGCSMSTDQVNSFDLRPSWWAVETGLVPDYPDVWRFSWIPYMSDTLAVQQIINNDLDTSELRPVIQAALMAQSDHVSSWTGRKLPWGYLDWWCLSVYFTTVTPPYDNPKVRWAVAYSIDQQQVVDVGYAGAGKASAYPFPEYPPLQKNLDSFADILAQHNPMEFNLDKAAQLMGEAGFKKDSDGFWVDKDGKRPNADLYAEPNLFGDIGPVVVSQLRSAGFDCQMKSPPDIWAAYADGRAVMFIDGHGGAVNDIYDGFQLYRKEFILPVGQQSNGNLTRWTDPNFETLMDQLTITSPDDPKAMDLIHQLAVIWYDALPDCPLSQWFHYLPYNTTYWNNWPTDSNPYMAAAPWYLTVIDVLLNLKATQA